MQTEYSLWTRNAEVAVLDTCRELGITFVAFSPLARGFLTGELRDVSTLPPKDIRLDMPRFQAEHLEQNLALLDGLAAVAASTAARWGSWRWRGCWRAAPHIVPIPGTTRVDHLDENVGAVDVRLSADTMARSGRPDQPRTVSGPRYSEAVQRESIQRSYL